MVTLVVEDGSGLQNANTYVSLTEVGDFLDSLDEVNAWESIDEDAKNYLLVASTIYLDTRYRFYGKPWTQTQILQWPRTKNFDRLGRILSPGTIPAELKRAQVMLVGATLSGEDVLSELGTESPVDLKAFSTEGLSFTFGDKASNNSLYTQVVVDVSVLLRAIGTLKDPTFLTKDRITEK